MTDMTASGKLKLSLNSIDSCEDFIFESENTRHILILVPGTTDPVNSKEKLSSNASRKYWNKAFLEGMDEFTKGYTLKSYVPQFSWTGDNEIKARQKAASDLLIWIKNVTWTERYKNIPVHVHFIAHSHGGNVINEFTKFAAGDAEYTDNIKVRSIVYLSTPFFKNQAQIETNVLHEKCKIINVYNKYDLTQRFVANFSMNQMPALTNAFKKDNEFKETVKKLAEAPYLKMTAYLLSIPFTEGNNPVLSKTPTYLPLWITSNARSIASLYTGPKLWEEILEVLKNIGALLSNVQFILKKLAENYPEFITNDILNALIDDVLDPMEKNLISPINNLQTRLKDDNAIFTLNGLFEDVGPGIGDFIDNFNRFLRFKKKDSKNTSGLRSNFSNVIGKILLNQIETFDDTTHKPDEQFTTPEAKQNGHFDITHIDVTSLDPYDAYPESKNYDAFIEKMETLEDKYDKSNQKGTEGANIRAEIVFNLLAQENYGVFNLLDIMLIWMDALTSGRTESLIRKTRDTIATYSEKLNDRDNNIIHHDLGQRSNISYYLPYGEELDKTYRRIKHKLDGYFTTPFGEAKGGIPYLAVESHSVSRRKLLNQVSLEWGKVMPLQKYTRGYRIKRACDEK